MQLIASDCEVIEDINDVIEVELDEDATYVKHIITGLYYNGDVAHGAPPVPANWPALVREAS